MYSLIIADDEEICREGLASYINAADLGFEVVACFEDGKETIEYLSQNEVDVVLTDIKMSQVSGIEVAEYVFNNNLPTKVILISGYEEFEFAQKALENRVEYYFVKPTEIEQIYKSFSELKQKLDNEQMVKNKLEEYDELIMYLHDEFIEDIVLGKLKNALEIRKKASQIRFDIDFEKCIPCVIGVEFDEADMQLSKYGATGFSNMVKNYLQLSKDEAIRCFQISESKNNMDFLVLLNDSFGFDEARDYIQSKISDMREWIKKVFNKNVSVFTRFSGNGFFEILDYLDRSKNDEQGTEDSVISRAVEYIENNYHREISLEDVSGYVYLNSVYFSRYFKQHTGERFTDYLIRIRMEKAIEILKQNKYKIYEVGEKVGYKNSKYFQKLFKDYTGYTPKTYCRSVLKVSGVDESV